MSPERIRELLEAVAKGEASTDEAMARLRDLPYADLGYANVDHHRSLRQGFPEAVYAEHKTAEQIAAIAEEIARAGSPLLVTRLDPEKLGPLARRLPAGIYDPLSRTFRLRPERAKAPEVRGHVAVVCAGTSDLPVAEEAALIVTVAGMEGTLPTAVAGLVSAPVVAVPTSVGYGASLGGVAALLAMLTSCAPNVAVVNIDNGFGAGVFAATINGV